MTDVRAEKMKTRAVKPAVDDLLFLEVIDLAYPAEPSLSDLTGRMG